MSLYYVSIVLDIIDTVEKDGSYPLEVHNVVNEVDI